MDVMTVVSNGEVTDSGHSGGHIEPSVRLLSDISLAEDIPHSTGASDGVTCGNGGNSSPDEDLQRATAGQPPLPHLGPDHQHFGNQSTNSRSLLSQGVITSSSHLESLDLIMGTADTDQLNHPALPLMNSNANGSPHHHSISPSSRLATGATFEMSSANSGASATVTSTNSPATHLGMIPTQKTFLLEELSNGSSVSSFLRHSNQSGLLGSESPDKNMFVGGGSNSTSPNSSLSVANVATYTPPYLSTASQQQPVVTYELPGSYSDTTSQSQQQQQLSGLSAHQGLQQVNTMAQAITEDAMTGVTMTELVPPTSLASLDDHQLQVAAGHTSPMTMVMGPSQSTSTRPQQAGQLFYCLQPTAAMDSTTALFSDIAMSALGLQTTAAVPTACLGQRHPQYATALGSTTTTGSNESKSPEPKYPLGCLQPYITRVSPATISWLINNYETADGVSLPRSTLYDHYQKHCEETDQDPVNAASFGKLIRSVFLGLKTRRIGTRGNSKYHYYGIRVKPESQLNDASEPNKVSSSPESQQEQHQANESFSSVSTTSEPSRVLHKVPGNPDLRPMVPVKKRSFSQGTIPSSGPCNPASVSNATTGCNGGEPHGINPFLKYFGPAVREFPDFPDLKVKGTEESRSTYSKEDFNDSLQDFYQDYKSHCIEVMDCIASLKLHSLELLWEHFWTSFDWEPESDGSNEWSEDKAKPKKKRTEGPGATQQASFGGDFSPLARVSQDLLELELVQDFIVDSDLVVYQHATTYLIPEVLGQVPNELTLLIRNFARGLEGAMEASLRRSPIPEELASRKVKAAGVLCQTLRRYTGLNHLAQAARVVLQNSGQIKQMLSDLNRVDFGNVQEQASWVCQCDSRLVRKLEQEFKSTLKNESDLETWASWMETVVDRSIGDYFGKPCFLDKARAFLLKWSFYSSMVIRDLTLRSAACFGSFHLIRLLYDEYMFYLVEQRVARSTKSSPMGVMAAGSMPRRPSMAAELSCEASTPERRDLFPCLKSPDRDPIEPEEGPKAESDKGDDDEDQPKLKAFKVDVVNGNGAASPTGIRGGNKVHEVV